MDEDGSLYVFTKSVYSEWPYPIRAFDAVSVLDYETGLPPLIRGIDRAKGSFPATCDEVNNLTVAGDKLYDTHDHVLAYMDIKSKKVFNAYSSHAPELWGGVFKCSAPDNCPKDQPGAVEAPRHGHLAALLDPVERPHTGGGGDLQGQGLVDHRLDGGLSERYGDAMSVKLTLVTLAGVIVLMAGPAVAADAPAFPYDASKTASYLNETVTASPAGSAAELRKEIGATVDEILDGPWAPLYSDYSAAQAGGVGPAEWSFVRPGEQLLALSQAAPYLSAEQKAKARTQLQALIKAFPPSKQVYIAQKQGKPRTIRKARERLARELLRDDRALGRLDGHREDRLAALVLDVARDAGDRAAGADARDEDVDGAVGVVPDLRPGGRLVDRGVGGILELLRQDVARRVGGGDLLGLARSRPSCPSGPGVRTSFAPKAASSLRRSMLIVSGMVSVSG